MFDVGVGGVGGVSVLLDRQIEDAENGSVKSRINFAENYAGSAKLVAAFRRLRRLTRSSISSDAICQCGTCHKPVDNL